jgi:hypothetical protein
MDYDQMALVGDFCPWFAAAMKIAGMGLRIILRHNVNGP